MCQCIVNIYVRISSGIQLWLICHSNCLTRPILSFFYFIDLVFYTLGKPKEFLTRRSKVLGRNFAALGRIIVGEYGKTAQLIDSPQQRGYYLGRAKLVESKFPSNMLLFMSDEDAGGTGLHKKLHDYIWMNFIPPAMERISSDPAFESYIADFVNKAGTKHFNELSNRDQDKVSSELLTLTAKYIFHALFGAPLTPKLVENVTKLFLSSQTYITTATRPLHIFFCCQNGSRKKMLKELEAYVLESPAMKDMYTPSEDNDMTGTEEMTELIVAVAGIAGCLGTSNLLKQVLLIPSDYIIDFNDQMKVLRAILEAARMRSPVNNVNTIIPEAANLIVNGRDRRLPKGTVCAASIGLAMMDPNEFDAPDTYNPERENLVKTTLNFNNVGFTPLGSGTRQCPGRNVAVHLATELLKAVRES